jgi:hypothetical protein
MQDANDSPVWKWTRKGYVAAPEPGRHLVVISDTHCGSSMGLLPPEFVSPETGPIGQNDFQRWLWECWTELWQHVYALPGGYDVLVNGDLIEGFHHRATQVNGTTPSDHVQMFMEAFDEPAKHAQRIWIIRGTEAHTGAASEDGIAKHYQACATSTNQKLLAADRITFDRAGVPCLFAHHMPCTSREWLKAGPMGIALAQQQLARARAGKAPPRLVGMAHSHVGRIYTDMSAGPATAFVTPAWQGPTRYTHRLMIGAETVVGAVIIDWENVQDIGLPTITPWHRRLAT